MPKNIYGNTTRQRVAAPDEAQKSIDTFATTVDSAKARIVSIVEQITKTPDISTKNATLQRIILLQNELAELFK